MDSIENMFNIDSSILIKSKEIEENLKCVYEEIEDIALYNQAKVLKAFKDNRVSQMHMNKTTGYGYNDVGREVIEKIYADIFHTEDSLVRVQFVNGTHTIATVLQALLMPEDTLLAISGRPYDTLCEVIGITKNKDNASKMQEYYKNKNYETEVKTFFISNEKFNEIISNLDSILINSNDEVVINEIINQGLNKYEEVILSGSKN